MYSFVCDLIVWLFADKYCKYCDFFSFLIDSQPYKLQ